MVLLGQEPDVLGHTATVNFLSALRPSEVLESFLCNLYQSVSIHGVSPLTLRLLKSRFITSVCGGMFAGNNCLWHSSVLFPYNARAVCQLFRVAVKHDV